MKKAIVTVATITLIGISSTFLTSEAHADTVQDLQNRQSQVQDERSDIKANLANAKEEIKEIMVELEELNEEISQINDALVANEEMIDHTNEEMAATEEEIEELEELIDERKKILKDRMVSYQRNGGNIGFLDVIFGSKSFGDFISRITAVNKITASDTELMDQQERDKEEVENKFAELQDMAVELEGMQEVITVQKEENESKKLTLKNKEDELQSKIKNLQLKDSELASLEAQVNRQIASKRQTRVASTVTSKSNSSNDSSSKNLTTVSRNQSKAQPASGSLSTILNAGYPHIGTPYVWAGKGPGGFDCSGFVSWAYAQGGYSIPSSTAGLQYTGVKISYSNIQPGDLVFFNTYKTNGHVGIYIGNGKFIGAQNSTGLAIADMTTGYWKNKFAGHVRRVIK
ncbi:C40 family peptidase [Ornithinibacillus halophilus]|uniref:N-terminal domain of peptidoglycan hydrolase CwlO-containing protein n=1 Tax=Ornithinibacillus halophilus TaxID=930117 RepID=A0A1M5F662_9BACI|nr:C40 family peptidase [Ornithinibacillus halophilus]SHF87100.1 N-terminal domain of peptidoglycan hydrolase CwlO-containing protein [Ornithinibacillus halophilus]